MRLRDVRAETDRGDLGRIGVTALLEDGDHTLVHFGLRNWPDDGSADHLEWAVSDSNNGTELARLGGGFGGAIETLLSAPQGTRRLLAAGAGASGRTDISERIEEILANEVGSSH